MQINDIKAVQKTLAESQEWLQDLMNAYDFEDEEEALVLVRATLKTIRDRITHTEAYHLGTQLPALLRGYYYEAWDPDKTPLNFETSDGFISAVRNFLVGHDNIDLEMAVPEVMKIIFDKLGQGEANHVRQNLPSQVQEFLS
jgi:uncharacterized protein (DUF2267 family)